MKPTETEIDDQLNKASDGFDTGGNYPGMSYEQGIMETIMWMRGDSPDKPMEE
jgi:hypothetical protein